MGISSIESSIGVDSTTKPRIRLIITICWILIGVGAVSLIVSIVSVSQILAFIGLSLIFWGGILLYVKPEGYAKQVLLDATMFPTLENLDQMINELGYKGEVIYLPPKYLRDPENYKAYLSKNQREKTPEPNLILKQKNQLFLKNPEAILFTPPGAKLTKLFENRLGINFSLVSIIGKKDHAIIKVRIINSIFKDIIKENPKLFQISHKIGPPIISAIACALAKTTGKPVNIADIQSYKDANLTTITYKVENFEYTEPIEVQFPVKASIIEKPEKQDNQPIPYKKIQTPILKTKEKSIQTFGLPRLVGLSIIAIGAIIFIWMSFLTWNDVTIFNKDLGEALLMYRTGEPIGLGIGMKFIHYFMLGSVLIVSGVLLYLKRGKRIIEFLNRPPLIQRMFDLALVIIGASILVWISELVLYELVVWHKNLIFILFAYGSNESIGLGIGMKVIYYFMVGAALILSGSFSYLRRKKSDNS
ncbi:MAG: hypothetical protein P8Y18_11335 [Candidatus Bathyarchaeota archaeon]